MEKFDDKTLKLIERYQKHIDETNKIAEYAVNRFDILVISLSTAALGFSISFKKDFDGVDACDLTLKFAWLFLILCIISNLLSQVSSYYSCKYEVLFHKNKIRLKENKEANGDQKKIDLLCSFCNSATNLLNGISLFSIIVGKILLLIFFWRYA
ncbi:hypothetical protein KJK34_08140 [Flavobacterium sp. D11R37]|uniref:hypothetical protein n=1 Tax=Flavobacterium coralii TaxID=2838017 RepID=UPI001CA62B63|nr:hypothetical protein [Flavobacterium coralii]MBY8962717.1 hypothetical protein [Flavobacterium coralii]